MTSKAKTTPPTPTPTQKVNAVVEAIRQLEADIVGLPAAVQALADSIPAGLAVDQYASLHRAASSAETAVVRLGQTMKACYLLGPILARLSELQEQARRAGGGRPSLSLADLPSARPSRTTYGGGYYVASPTDLPADHPVTLALKGELPLDPAGGDERVLVLAENSELPESRLFDQDAVVHLTRHYFTRQKAQAEHEARRVEMLAGLIRSEATRLLERREGELAAARVALEADHQPESRSRSEQEQHIQALESEIRYLRHRIANAEQIIRDDDARAAAMRGKT
mgnify:CR=1 FL=1